MINNKKILIFLILLIIAIPFSFAGDENMTGQAADDSLMGVENITLTQNSNDNDILSAGDVYFDASAASNGDGSISRPYKYVTSSNLGSNNHFASGTYKISTGVSSFFSQSMTFTGNNRENTIIEYTGSGSFIETSSDLTFSGITLKGVHIVSTGGVITATNTIFDGGKAPVELEVDSAYHDNSYGGAIKQSITSSGFDWGSIFGGSSSKPGMSFENCIFRNNYAAYGGAIYADGGTISISNTLFENNNADNGGGSIFVNNGADITIDKSYFNRDYSKNDAGGAIYAFNQSKVSVKNSNFNDCTATAGSAITSLNSQTTVSSSNFNRNKASWNGGAIYAMYGTLSVQNSNFNSNSAKNGGAIFADNLTSFEVNGGEFQKNTAEDTAGAIFAFANKLNKITNPSYISNKASNKNDAYETDTIDLIIGSDDYEMMQYKSSYNGVLPSKYDLRNYGAVTPVKDQGQSGNCWAFATIATLESAILKATGKQYILSEGNLKNLAQLFSDIGWAYETNNGGQYQMALGYLTSWAGPVNYTSDPTDDWDVIAPILNSVMHVQNVQFIQRTGYTDNDVIKQTIMKYGAVASEIYWSNSYLKGTSDYYYNGNSGRNHAISVIGWDDTRSISGAPGPGAWIIKNSYGPNHGENGYYYVSYYDHSLFRLNDVSYNSYAFILNDTVRYNKNYQYDASFTDYFITGQDTMWYKNTFTSTGNDILSAFSTYFNRLTTWEAKVYVNDVLRLTQNGKTNFGYYTISLSEQIPLNIGDRFTIELKIQSRGNAEIPISEPVVLTKDYTKEGVSFFSKDGVTWTDFYNYQGTYGSGETGHNYYSQVACLKAFTIAGTGTVLNSTIDVLSYNSTSIVFTVKDQNSNPISSGVVNFALDAKMYSADVSNGLAIANIYISSGNHRIIAEYGANQLYNSSRIIKTITLEKEDLTLKINSGNIIYGEDLIMNITLYNANGDEISLPVSIEVNGRKYSNGDKISGLLPGLYEIKVSSDSTDSFNSANATKTVTVEKINLTLEVVSEDITEGESLKVIAVVPEKFSGSLNLTVNGKTYTAKALNSKVTFNVDNLKEGKYDYSLYSVGDNIFNPVFVKKSVNVNSKQKENLGLTVDVRQVLGESKVCIDVTLSQAISADLTLNISNQTYTTKSENGYATFIIFNLTYGLHEFEVSFEGDGEYNPVSNKSALVVMNPIDVKDKLFILVKPEIVTDGDTTSISIILPNDVSSDLKLNINNKTYTSKAADGKVKFVVSGLPVGIHEYEIIFEGDEKYEESSFKSTLTIKEHKQYPLLIISDFDIIEGEDAIIKIVLPADIYSNITLYFNSKQYSGKPKDGQVIFTIPDLKTGQYDYYVFFGGDKKYESNFLSDSIKVYANVSTIISQDMKRSYMSDYDFKATLLDKFAKALVNQKTSVEIDGKTYDVYTDDNGILKVNFNLAVGKHTVAVTNPVTGEKSQNTVMIVKRIAENKDATADYGENSYYKVRIYDDDGKAIGAGETVTFNVDGKNYNVKTDKNGYASFKITMIPKTYKITAEYKKVKVQNKITVKPVIKSKNLSKKKAKTIKYSITLKTSKGKLLVNKKVTFKVNGKTYSVKTNSKGIASVSLKNLKVGKYTVKTTYVKHTVKNTIQIKK